MNADIKYLQIGVPVDQRKYLQILFRFNDAVNIRSFAFSRQPFGLKSSHYIAMRTVRQLASDMSPHYPDASRVAESSLYMDDLVHSPPDVDTAKQLSQDLITMFKFARQNAKFIPRSVNCLKAAEHALWRAVQSAHFADDISLLRAHIRPLKKPHLAVFLDEEGVLRIGGRHIKVIFPVDAKHSVLLPKRDNVVGSIIQHYHVVKCHTGPGLLMSIIRQRFWILDARTVIRAQLRKCNSCFKVNPTHPTLVDIKTHLYRVIDTQLLAYEEFQTFLTHIKCIMNSRPLCVLSSDQLPEVLTPFHFLMSTPLQYLPAPDLSQQRISLVERKQLLDSMVQSFWKKWRLEYLHTLQVRQKWATKDKAVEVGTVVLVEQDNSMPLSWPLGVITEVYKGSDNIVRVAMVKTNSGFYKRPVVKLYPIPTQ